MAPWKVLVVDDEEGIHGITRMIFRGYEFEQRPIELISAMSSADARALLDEHPDTALALLDVVMETDHEGLRLVEHIRNDLNNQDMRIILRTGHPGYAPEAQVIVNYDINDYLSKAELSASRLLTSVVVALRSFRDIKQARQQTSTEPAVGDNALLDAAAGQLNAQIEPILKQSQRLQQLDLNPVARDLSSELHSRNLRLHNSVKVLQEPLQQSNAQMLEPSALLDELLNVFLPQSRREGWLLDYSLDPSLPNRISAEPDTLRQLLISALELAILQADGNDLRLQAEPASQAGFMQLSITQISGQSRYASDPWASHLRSRICVLAEQLNGQLLAVDDSHAYRCLLPL